MLPAAWCELFYTYFVHKAYETKTNIIEMNYKIKTDFFTRDTRYSRWPWSDAAALLLQLERNSMQMELTRWQWWQLLNCAIKRPPAAIWHIQDKVWKKVKIGKIKIPKNKVNYSIRLICCWCVKYLLLFCAFRNSLRCYFLLL